MGTLPTKAPSNFELKKWFGGTFAEKQYAIDQHWRKYKKPIRPTEQRRLKICGKCNKLGYRVRMDYLGNRHEKAQVTVYDVHYWKCPRCQFVYKEPMRIEGRGSGVYGDNSGKRLGGQ